jgi:hypothetical protein
MWRLFINQYNVLDEIWGSHGDYRVVVEVLGFGAVYLPLKMETACFSETSASTCNLI